MNAKENKNKNNKIEKDFNKDTIGYDLLLSFSFYHTTAFFYDSHTHTHTFRIK